ncbi:MAG TPA: ABC transporter substrate-binding protein [Patescibacteria group bacterium]|nr:ABC transporter substrate-binding protein [Patescibacteria group bacterium]
MRNSVKMAVIACAAATFTLTIGCGDKGKDADLQDSRNVSATTNNTWKKFDTPPGADKSVPAEMGGEGFENIAAAQGFVTYQPSEGDLQFFGDPRAKTGGVFRATTPRFPLALRTIGQNSNYTENSMMEGMVYETLLGTHPVTLEFVPSLASHWKIGDDKKTFTFRIDPNARFSDGKPVTAEDVVASWRLRMDESILEPSQQLVYGKFEEPKALSKYLLEVKAKTLNFRNLLYFAANLYVFPSHEIGNLTGKEFIDQYQFKMPAGSGEYILLPGDVTKGQAYALTRRDDYWRKDYPTSKYTGNFDKIKFEVVRDNPELEYEKFKKGEQDFFRFSSVTTEKWVNDTTYPALKNGWVTKYRVLNNAPMGNSGYAFNMRKPPFNDIRVRKAFAYLHNRESIISQLLFNEYTPQDSYYSNTDYENPNNIKVRYNPQLAAQLLAEAGWKTKNANGILVKDGKPFVIEMGLNKVLERFVTPYQQELKKAGIDLQIKFQDPNTLFTNAMERNFTMYWINWTGLVIPNPETSLKSSLADQKDNNNIEGFKNARVDQLLDIYDSTFTRSKQVEIIKEIDKIQTETFMTAAAWNPRGIRFAVWNKFGVPENVLGKFTQLGDLENYVIGYWWHDEEKAQALENARKNNTPLNNPRGIQENKFWKNR